MAINGADIELLFGVAGGDSVSDGSGKLIRDQLNNIVATLNNASHTKERLIRVSLDMENTKTALAKSLETISRQITGQNKFRIKLAKIDADSAIKDLQSRIQSVLSTLSIKNGMSVSIKDFTSGGQITGDPGGATSLDDASARATEYAGQLATVRNLIKSINATELRLLNSSGADAQQVTDMSQRIRNLRSELDAFAQAKNQPNQALVDTAIAEAEAIKAETAAMQENATATRNRANADTEANKALDQSNKLITQSTINLRKWTAAQNGKSSAAYAGIDGAVSALKELNAQFLAGNISPDDYAQKVDNIGRSIGRYNASIQQAGENTRSFSDRIGGLASKFSTWFSLTRVIMAAFRAVKQMVRNVIELDSAMTQLQIVTGATDSKMVTFLKSATAQAKELGQSVTDVLKSIETFSRLGYNLDESSILAKYTGILANVAGVGSEEATTGVTSIIKGFNMDVSETEHVADVLIDVGQKYAVSAAELMEAFEKSGAALNATNTSFEKSAGLIAAANASVQNASTVGTALKTISARIRGSKSDLEELGEDPAELADGFSKYAKELRSLTGFNIMVDGTTNTFKDIYDILQGIASVWAKLSDTQQARVAEILGGTRQLQVISSILGNWQDAAGAYQSAMESAGTATEANATYMESIEGKIGQFKATFQELSDTLIGSDFVKQFVELGIGLLKILNGVAKLIDAIGGLNTVLVATAGIIATIKAQAIWHMITVTLPAAITKLSALFASFSLQNIGAAVSLFFESVRAGNGVISSFTGVVGAATVGINTFKLALGAATLIITGVVVALQKAKQQREEARQTTLEAARDAKELSTEIVDLTGKYLELSEAVKTDKSAKESLLSTQNELIDKLGIEKGKIRELTKEYGSLSDAVKAAAVDKLHESERDLRAGVRQTEKDALSDVSDTWYGAGKMDINAVPTDNSRPKQVELYKGLTALTNAGYISAGSYSTYYDDKTGERYSAAGTLMPMIDLDLKSIDGAVTAYDRLGKMLDIVEESIGFENKLYDAIYDKYNSLSSSVGAYKDAISSLNENLATQYMLNGLIGRATPKTQREFNAYRDSVVEAAQSSDSFIGSNVQIEDVINDILKKQPAFVGFYQHVADAAEDATDASEALDDLVGSSHASNTVEQIAKAETEINKISKVLGDFSENGAVSATTIDTLRETFGNCESFQNFVNVMSDANSTMEQAQAASDKLATEWINQLNLLDLVNVDTADSVEALLELTGVTNAHEVVIDELNAKTAEGMLASRGLQDASLSEASARLQEMGASEALINSLARLRAEQYNVAYASNSLISASQSEFNELIKLAGAAGLAASKITALKKAKDLKARYETYRVNPYEKEHYKELMEQYQREAESGLAGKISVQVDVPTLDSKKNKKGSSSKEVDKYIADIDRLRKKKEILRRKELEDIRISDLISRTDDSIDGLKERIALTQQLIDGYEEENRQLHELAGAYRENGEYDYDTARAEILEKINKFESDYGIQIQYNAQTNELLCDDLEKINQLTADNSKNYDTAAEKQEATNKLIQQAEKDYKEIVDLNKENIERSAQYEENVGKIHEKNKENLETLKQIVEVASSMVDEVQGVYDTLQKAADEYAANDGFISVDTFQEITAAGLEYMQYLTDENGLLKMERENIQNLIKARTEYMALEAAESYVKRVIASTDKDALENTDRLTLAQDNLTASKWSYLDALLKEQYINGKLNDDQYAGALENLHNYRMILTGVSVEFDAHADKMAKANESMDKILEYTIELVKQQVQDEIDGLNDLVDQYNRLIDAKKEALDKTKEEDDYADEMLEKTKQLAKLRTDADLLRLAANSGDRGAEAKLVKNLEEQSELQKEIDEKQRDHAIDAQKEALDKMAEDYKEQKDDEIEELEKSISSQQKLYDKAIAYINAHWDTLYTELLKWNYEYGSTIDDEITQNWVLAKNALDEYKLSYSELMEKRNAEKYGTFDTTINKDGTSAVTQTSPTQNDVVAKNRLTEVNNKVIDMKTNSEDWKSTSDPKARSWLAEENTRLAGEVERLLNVKLERKSDGAWYLPDGRKLYDVYGGKFHSGGIVGGGMLRENEQMAVLQKGEPIISNAHKQSLFDLVDFATVLSNRLGDISPAGLDLVSPARNDRLMERLMEAGSGSAPSIHFGDVYIYGGDDETVRKHKEVNREFANEVLKYLHIKP